jgi:hypothetical protein
VEDLLLHLRPQAFEVAELPRLDRRPQVVQVPDSELAPEPEESLGTEPGDGAELDEIPGVLRAQLLELRDSPLLEELADLLRGAGADAVDPREILLREGGEVSPVAPMASIAFS